MPGGNLSVDFNGFEKYSLHVLRLPNTETGESEINMISEKYQDNDKFILNNALSDVKRNQTPGTIK